MFRSFTTLLVVLTALLSACGGATSTPEPQPPKEYLEGALNWIQTHAVFGDKVDWDAVRHEASTLVSDPQITADTYPAICLALKSLNDGNAWLYLPDQGNIYTGLHITDSDHIVFFVEPDSPAEHAGIQVGDTIETINDAPPESDSLVPPPCGPNAKAQVQLTLRRAGQTEPVEMTINQAEAPGFDFQGKPQGKRLGAIGYMELPYDPGFDQSYPGLAQQLMRKLDQTPVCGWIIDLRRNTGGDIWTYLAAVGPILGEGDLGGFVYRDGTHELWTYRDGQVFWNEQRREESVVEGGIYQPKRTMPPVALLIGPATTAAGELVVVAFQGYPNVHIFGEPTRGFPTLILHTELSNGVWIFASGAFATGRNGNVYDGPIPPDESVKTDWTQFGTDHDPVLSAANDWLQTQPECIQ